jgi:hypothetical protein
VVIKIKIPSSRRRLLLESLENRSLMAGDIDLAIGDATFNEANLTAFTANNSAILQDSADIAFGPSRNADTLPDLYVLGRTSGNIAVYDGLSGSFIENFVNPGVLRGPAWLKFGANGDLFTSTVSATGKRDTIVRIDQATKTASTFFSDSSLTGAKGMAFGPDENFYLADVNTDRVARYDGTSGQFIDNFIAVGSGLDAPAAVIFGNDRDGDGVSDIYVSSSFTNEVLLYSGATGAPLGAFVSAGSGGMVGPGDMEFGPDGNLYVVRGNDNTVVGNEQVYRYDGNTGAFIDIVIPPAESLPRPRSSPLTAKEICWSAVNGQIMYSAMLPVRSSHCLAKRGDRWRRFQRCRWHGDIRGRLRRCNRPHYICPRRNE